MQIKQIVVATDFSEQSDSAIRHGLNIARSAGARLRFVHVVETPADEEGLESALPAVQHWHADDAARLARDIEAYGADDIDISTEIVDAPSAANGLQSVVDAHGADLAIVGTTGAIRVQTGVARQHGSESSAYRANPRHGSSRRHSFFPWLPTNSHPD